MRVVLYRTDEELRAALEEAHSRGETQIHDDHNVGDDGENRLILDRIEDVAIDPEQIRLSELQEKLYDRDLTSVEINEMLRLERRRG